jgi:hypothetical protein
MTRPAALARAVAIFIGFAALTARSATAAQCTAETLAVQGTTVTIAYCVTGPPRPTDTQEIIVPVLATFSAPAGSLRRASELHFLAGEGVSRVLESLDLSKLGLTGTLHLTLAYIRGLVHVEGALLTPGAITIK